MQKETEEITTEAVGQPTSVNDDDAEKNLSLRLLFKVAKKSQKNPVSTLQSETNQLTEKRDTCNISRHFW